MALLSVYVYSIFSKTTQPFDFIKSNLIKKLASKVKYASQINGVLIMFFFGNSRIRFFKKKSIQEKTQSTVGVQSLKITFHRFIDNFKKRLMNKGFRGENSIARRESRIATS